MSNFKRKLRRNNARSFSKTIKKQATEQKMLFELIPDHCLNCYAPFDKTDREMVNSWFVTVREKEEVVKLFCPPCWNKAREIVEDLKERANEKST